MGLNVLSLPVKLYWQGGKSPVRRFVVVDKSMLPTLRPGDGLLAWRDRRVRKGQLRVFPDPWQSSQWLVKRVGEVSGRGLEARFEAVSDNPRAAGVIDSREFGLVPVRGSYRVIWTVRGPSV